MCLAVDGFECLATWAFGQAEDRTLLFGTPVQIAARLCASADPGTIVVSRVLYDLCAGKSIPFEDGGTVELKGIAEPVQIFHVRY